MKWFRKLVFSVSYSCFFLFLFLQQLHYYFFFFFFLWAFTAAAASVAAQLQPQLRSSSSRETRRARWREGRTFAASAGFFVGFNSASVATNVLLSIFFSWLVGFMVHLCVCVSVFGCVFPFLVFFNLFCFILMTICYTILCFSFVFLHHFFLPFFTEITLIE